MKKYLFLLSLLAIGCSGAKHTTDLEVYQLTGNVASVKVSICKAESKFGEAIKGDLEYNGISITEFDKSGYITLISVFRNNGNIDSKSIYSYKNGNIDSILEYDSDGDLKTKMIHNWDGNKLLSAVCYDEDGKEIFQVLNEYENESLKSFSSFYDGELETKRIMTKYNGEYELESVSYDKDGNEKGKHVKEWKDKQLVKDEYISDKESSYLILYENGRPIKTVDCRMVLRTIYLSCEGSYYYEYKFDDKDNWIKCVVYKGENKQPYQIIEREITYR